MSVQDGELVSAQQQADVKGRLEADDFFSDITILSEDDGDVESQLLIALGVETVKDGKFGACVIVQQPIGDDEQPGVQFGAMMLDWTFLVLENRLLNKDTAIGGTGKKAWTIARRIHRIMKNYRAGGLTGNFTPARPCIVPTKAAIKTAGGDKVMVGYEVRYRGMEGDPTRYAKVATPQMSAAPALDGTSGALVGAAGATVTLTCATAGAAIYFTKDNSHPSAKSIVALGGTAELYAAPFVVAAACTLRVCAFKTGSIASDVAAARFE